MATRWVRIAKYEQVDLLAWLQQLLLSICLSLPKGSPCTLSLFNDGRRIADYAIPSPPGIRGRDEVTLETFTLCMWPGNVRTCDFRNLGFAGEETEGNKHFTRS